MDDLGERVDAVLRGPIARVGLESTVVDATGDAPVLLRPRRRVAGGAPRGVPRDHRLLRARTPTAGAGRSARPASGTATTRRRARVRLVAAPPERGDRDAAYIGLAAPPPGYGLVEVCPDLDAYARRLFDFFRRADAAGLARIDAEAVPEGGVGRAILDRLRRAAEG